MSKTVQTLWLAASLALSWATKANAQVNKNSDETQHQIENAFKQQKNINSNDTISFEDAKTLYENQQFFEEVLNDKKIQYLINEYWEDEVKQIINEFITNEDTKKVIEMALWDDNIQKAIKEWDTEKVEKWIQKIAEKVYRKVRWTDFTRIIGVIVGTLLIEMIKVD